MNLTNKLTMVHGWGGAYVGDVPEQTLSDGTYIPPMHHHDGPQGVANGNTDVTCWPSALTVVQSWDPALMAEYGAGMGLEQVREEKPRACLPVRRLRATPRAANLFPPAFAVQEGHQFYAGSGSKLGAAAMERPQLVRCCPP